MKAVQSVSAVLSAVMILSVSAYADHGGHDRGGYYAPHYGHGNWIIPLMVGGVIGYALSEPHRETVTYVQPVQPQIIYQAPVYQSQPIYQEQWVYFNDCDCQRKVLVPIR
jgi:hypothetical protein